MGPSPAFAATIAYAAVLTQNPAGTGNPTPTSSPRFAALPPTDGKAVNGSIRPVFSYSTSRSVREASSNKITL